MSLELFQKLGFSPTSIQVKTANYTALATDDQINITGSGVILTLPSLLSLQQTMQQKKLYAVYNNGATYPITIQPGTNGSTGVKDTINGRATWTLFPNETIVISGDSNLLDWKIASPASLPVLMRNDFCISVNTNGTTAVNVFDTNGAPANINITAILVAALDTTAGNIEVINAGNVVNDTTGTAKGTSAGVVSTAVALANTAVASGASLTVVSSSAGNATVIIFGNTQTLISFSN